MTAATVIRTTRAPLWRRILARIEIFALEWALHEEERYLRACAADGLVDSLSIRGWRDQMAAKRVRIALLRAML